MAAWVEDRWHVARKNADGSKEKIPSPRYGEGMRWRVRWIDPAGKERARSFARKPDADRYRTQVDAEMQRGAYIDPDAGKMTVQAWSAQWLAAQSFDDSTRETMERRVRHICAGLGGRTLAQLAASPSTVQAWVSGLKMAPSTARHCLRALSAICAAAVDDGRMARNPCQSRSVRAPQLPQRKVQPLERYERDAVREQMPARLRACVDAGARCGLRQGEILALSPDDIDFRRQVVHVRRQVKIVASRRVFALPKRGKTRDVPLAASAAQVFAAHIRQFPSPSATHPWHEPGTSRHGKPVTVKLLFAPLGTGPGGAAQVYDRRDFNTGVWKPALKKAGLPLSRENGMHILRHTYASVLLRAGVDIKRVAAYLGHEDAGFTLRVYGHLMKGGEEDARRAIDEAGAPDPEPADGSTGLSTDPDDPETP